MKKLLCMLALVFAGSAQAQVYFESGSTRPVNPGAVNADIERQQRARPPVKARTRLVRCRDGSRRSARMCRRVGGGVRR